MASGPSEPPRQPSDDDDSRAPEEPRIRHSPPGPTDDRARGLPLASPWGMPPFASPTPEDEPPDPPKGRRPYSSPTAEPEAEPRRRRRIVNRPDKLVASGPPRTQARPRPASSDDPPPPVPGPHDGSRPPEPDLSDGSPPEPDRGGSQPPPGPRDGAQPPPGDGAQPSPGSADQPPRPQDEDPPDAEPRREARTAPYRNLRPIPVEPEIATPPEHTTAEETAAPEPAEDEPVHRVGRPPGGRPTRPDLLVAAGPERPGRHHRGQAPAAMRRASPVRRRRVGRPIAFVVALAVAVSAGILVWRWWDGESSGGPGLRLAAGTGYSGDALFTVPSAGDGSNQKLNAMASAGKSVVAVGSDTTSPTPRPLFLYSQDSGKTWSLGTVNASTTATVQRVTGGDGRWLASGGDETGTERGLWTSADGATWTSVEPAGLAAFKKGDYVHDIARTASGFVAAGSTTRQDGTVGPAAWQSPDGRTWQRVDLRGLEAGAFKAVVARGDTVVAVAQPVQGEGSRVVRSTDGGLTWKVTGFQLPEALPRVGSLAVLPKQFVLVPIRQRAVGGEVRVYCSPTGADWAQCGSIGGLGGQSPGVETTVSHGAGIAAVSQAGLDKYTVLASTDGRDWTKRAELGDLSGATLRGFAIADSGTLFAGGDQAAADVDNQLVLIAAPARGAASRVQLAKVDGLTRIARETTRLAVAKGRYVAVGSASGDAGIWTSPDWENWTSISLGGPRRQTLNDVVYGRRGWLAAGATQTDLSTTDPLVVTSDDGRTWKKAAPPARPDGHPYLDVQAVAAGEKGYILAGEDRGPSGTASAAIWFTSDLRKFTRSQKLPQDGAGVRIQDVAATPDGYLAVGGAGAGDGEAGVVWTSKDGLNWTARKRVTPPGATSSGLRQVASYQGAVVAVGTAQTKGDRRAFAAVSKDNGVTWEFAWLPADRAAAVHDLAAGEHGLVAVGWHGAPGAGDSAAWISSDGLTWVRQDLKDDRLRGEGMQWLAAVTTAGTEVVAVGRSTTYNTDHLTLWTSTLTPR